MCHKAYEEGDRRKKAEYHQGYDLPSVAYKTCKDELTEAINRQLREDCIAVNGKKQQASFFEQGRNTF